MDSGFRVPLIPSPLDSMKNRRKGHSPGKDGLHTRPVRKFYLRGGLRLVAFQSHSDVQSLISDAEGDWRPLTKDWHGLNKASTERASRPEYVLTVSRTEGSKEWRVRKQCILSQMDR